MASHRVSHSDDDGLDKMMRLLAEIPTAAKLSCTMNKADTGGSPGSEWAVDDS